MSRSGGLLVGIHLAMHSPLSQLCHLRIWHPSDSPLHVYSAKDTIIVRMEELKHLAHTKNNEMYTSVCLCTSLL